MSLGDDDAANARLIHAALDLGVNYFDTADLYQHGRNEETLGKALFGRRDSVIIATKVGNQMNNDPQRRGLSRRWIIQACEDSLLRLGVEHIDLYQMHRPDVDTPIEESLQALNDLVKTGKVRAVGTSTFSVGQLIEARAGADALGIAPPSAEQPRTRCSRGAGRTMSACSPGRR
jgi:aryl-alcohol dehydrogenase (NADP+)